MADTFKKVRNGDKLRIPANTYNAMIDAAADFINRKNNLSSQTNKQLPANMVYIKNTTGAPVERLNILGIGGSEIDPNANTFKQSIVFTGVVPNSNHAKGRFVITAEPIAPDSVGKAYSSGFVPVRIAVTDESHTYADIYPDETGVLRSLAIGAAYIIWKEQGTGYKWAIVKINGGAPEPTPMVQWAKTETEAGPNTYIPARLYNAAGQLDVYETFDPEYYPDNHITVYCTICGTSPVALNQATPYLFSGTDIPVIQRVVLVNGISTLRWYCLWGFQKTYICGT
ncbi:MAG: hypothetical protein ABFD79_15380 [Phycisphaerales bacterium]